MQRFIFMWSNMSIFLFFFVIFVHAFEAKSYFSLKSFDRSSVLCSVLS